MRIGILSQWYDPEPGSAAVPGVLARALRARGHEVLVVTGFPNYPSGRLADGYRLRRRLDELTPDGVSVRRVALYPSHDRSPARRSLNYLTFALSATASGLDALRGVDAVWVYNSPATVGLPSFAATALGGPPHLMHVLDLWPESVVFSGIVGDRPYRRLEPLLEKWCGFTYRKAAAIACISQGVQQALADKGVLPEKLHHVPVWTDEERFFPRRRDEELAAELGVEDCFVLLYAGNLGEPQGLDTLIDVCRRLEDLDDFHCLVAGSGTVEERLRRRAEELRLRNISFLGRWPSSDMGRLMSVGDLHLVSLTEHPLSKLTLPSKMLATLACGRPVLVCARGEPARVVTEAGAGWVVAPGDTDAFEDAVRSAYRNTDLAVMASAGRRYYEKELCLDRGVGRIEDLLLMIAGDRRPRSRAK